MHKQGETILTTNYFKKKKPKQTILHLQITWASSQSLKPCCVPGKGQIKNIDVRSLDVSRMGCLQKGGG